MNLVFEEVTIKNFLSFGNVAQTINLNDKKYQIIVGQNKDKSDSEDDRNGVGKSTIFEAIHYALFGKSIGNKINLGTLVNNINKKNMYVTVKFTKDDTHYEITRGRLPNVLVFSINGEDYVQDESQGDSRDTQKVIEDTLGISEELFDQIICLSCKVPMYYNQSTANQKLILEKILGIDIISKKVEALKEAIKETKNEFNNEQFKINTIKTQNDNLLTSINKQISDMEAAKANRIMSINTNIKEITENLKAVEQIDIDKEMETFKLLENYLILQGVNQQNQQLKDSIEKTIVNTLADKDGYQNVIKSLESINFDEDAANRAYNKSIQEERNKYLCEENHYRENKTFLEQNLMYNFERLTKEIADKENEIANTKKDVCPTCGNPITTEKYASFMKQKNFELSKLKEQLHKVDMEILETNHLLSQFTPKTFEYKKTIFATDVEADEAKNRLNNAKQSSVGCDLKVEELKEQLSQIQIVDLGPKPMSNFTSMEQIMNLKAAIASYKTALESYKQQLNENPFKQQEESIEEMKKNIVEVDETHLRELDEKISNQNLLLKLLNSPTSFIRKAILEKSLVYLNQKIKEYLIKLGSMDIVSFNNDMTMTINRLGLNYGYVSTGEEGRISFALMMAFRDVWESLNNCSINLLAFDEIIDRIGLDTSGVACAVKTIKEKNDKNVFIVSHNDTLISQTSDVIKLIKHHGFTNIGEELE